MLEHRLTNYSDMTHFSERRLLSYNLRDFGIDPNTRENQIRAQSSTLARTAALPSNVDMSRINPVNARRTSVLNTTPVPSLPDDTRTLGTSGNPVYSDINGLTAAYKAGKFNANQYNSALTTLRKGAAGVDPLGFGNKPGGTINPSDPNNPNGTSVYGTYGGSSNDYQATIDQYSKTIQERGLTPYQQRVMQKYKGQIDAIDTAMADLKAKAARGESIGYGSLEEGLATLGNQKASLLGGVVGGQETKAGGTAAPLSTGTDTTGAQTEMGAPGSSSTPGGSASGNTSTTPGTGGSTPSTADGLPSLPELTAEERAAILPTLQALRAGTSNVRNSAGTQAGLLDRQQGNIDAFAQSANQTNQQIYDLKLEDAKASMDYESDLLKESLARQRRDEDLTYQETSSQLDRIELRQVADNAKTEQHLRTKLGSRYGGFGSGRGMEIIHEETRKGEELLNQIGEDRVHATQDHRNKLANVEADYRTGVKDIMVRHDASISTALQAALDKATSIDEKVLTEEGTLNDKAGTLVKETFTALNDIEEKTGSALSKANQDALKRKNDLRIEAEARKKEDKASAYNLFQFAFTNSTDTELRKQAVAMMKKAGYDLGNIDLNALTPSAYLKELDNAKKQDVAGKYDMFKYDDTERQDLMSSAINAVSRLPVAIQPTQLDKITGLLDTNQVERARQEIRGIVASGLTGTAKNEFDGRQELTQASDELIANLEAIGKTTDRGIYTKKWNELKKFAGKSQDPEYLNITAALGNLSSEVIKEKYGANVTGDEFKRAQEFIPLAGDTVLDAMAKLRQLKKFMNDRNDVTLNTSMGRIETSFSPGPVSYNNSTMESWINGTPPPGGGGESVAASLLELGSITQTYDTPIASISHGGLYDESTVRVWNGTHKGVDIAMKQGTPLPSPVSGEIIEAGYEGGWGGTVVIRDEAGGEHRFSHLSQVNFRPGMKVSPGQMIALSGGAEGQKGSGNSTGAHLDYRVKVNGQYVDPTTYYPSRTIASTSSRI